MCHSFRAGDTSLNWTKLILGTAAAGAGLLLYGAWTSDRLVLEKKTLRLPLWPEKLDGYRIGLLADFHLRFDGESLRMAQEAVEMIVAEDPDMLILCGDTIAYWQPGIVELIEQAFSGLGPLRGKTLAILGNHDYFCGPPDPFTPIFDELGIQLLRNQAIVRDGISWIGVESAMAGDPQPYQAIGKADASLPMIVLWHEPDAVDLLPRGLDLMLSGHSHGGQFCAPWGWAPMTSKMGSKYRRGFYSETSVPLYVNRGISTTGPPSRLNCPAEATILTLRPGELACVGSSNR